MNFSSNRVRTIAATSLDLVISGALVGLATAFFVAMEMGVNPSNNSIKQDNNIPRIMTLRKQSWRRLKRASSIELKIEPSISLSLPCCYI